MGGIGRVVVFGVLTVLGVLASCAGAPPAPPATVAGAASPQEASPASKPADARHPGPMVTLVHAGDAPRQPLRYRFHAGTIEFLELDMRFGLAMSMNDTRLGRRQTRTEVPTMRSVFRAEILEILPHGDARIDFTWEYVRLLEDVALDPQARRTLDVQLAQLLGMHARGHVSTRGVTSELEITLPPGASAEASANIAKLQESLRTLYVPFPELPVGRGAVWDVTLQLPIAGAVANVRYHCTLTQVSSASASYGVAVTLSASPQPMQVAADLTGTLDSLTGTGTGTMMVSWDHLVPTSTIEMSVDSTFTVASNATDKVQASLHSGARVTARPGKHVEDACDERALGACVERAKGLHSAKDYAKANALLEQACGFGDAEGCGFLAFNYLEGTGVAADAARAAQLFGRACGQKPIPALAEAGFCGMLGSLYRAGRGVPVDMPAALALFRRSCDGGWADSCSRVGGMLEDGQGTKRDGAGALAAYTRGCDGRDALGCLSLSLVYKSGKFGVTRDPARARTLEARACELCDASGCTFMHDVCPAKPAHEE
jgi:hypothetical protein